MKLFPLKHVIVFTWGWGEASTLSEVNQRLAQRGFYTVRPKANILVATSRTKPAIVIFTFIQAGREGGDLILIQTPAGPYTYDQIMRFIHLFAKLAGIRILHATGR